MKAAICTGYGKIEDVVEVRDIKKPVVLQNDVLIKVHAASVNPIDIKEAKGDLKNVRKRAFPYTMGLDVSGVVVEAGSGTSKFKVGDEVYSRVDSDRCGTFAEYSAVDEKFVARKPQNISHTEAAAVPLAGLTAWQCMFDAAGMKSGQKILIHAGSGGVGTIAIQIAKSFGAHVATTTSTSNVDLVTQLGADIVVDYKKQRFDEVLRDYDVVLETLGGENQVRSFSVLKNGGYLVSIVGIPSAEWAKSQNLPFYMPLLFGFLNRKNNQLARQKKAGFDMVLMQPNAEQLGKITDLIERDELRPVIDREFSLDEVQEALSYLQTGRAKGKIVINAA
ncbi:NADP-dependent oxidoreductase [Parvularcula sp. IMCC14364]|uniref:NADP-dependent oxidoreductase n=1 Tax=Parvularcula sp. IMCC14364 TaxID=3067902 RepID=UPI0027414DF7|nr:NADP-dependent oxidoreductase [Parvularcula sp. IMCC14364]